MLKGLEAIQKDFNSSQAGGKKVSLADLIVLGGAAAIEQAAKQAGHVVQVPFAPGRTDASQAQTDVTFICCAGTEGRRVPQLLRQEQPAFAGRNAGRPRQSPDPDGAGNDRAGRWHAGPERQCGTVAHGVFTDRPGTLSNDFFVNLVDMSTKWTKSSQAEGLYEGLDRATGKVKWTATPVDLVFGSNSELRAIAEVYAANDGREKFVKDFVVAWTKVMSLDQVTH